MSEQLFPEVIDVSNLGALFTQSLYMPIGVEGEMGSDGTAAIATIYTVSKPSDVLTLFGATSTLSNLLQLILTRGVSPVYAVASAKASPPTLLQRQAAWAKLESNPIVRIRLTDDTSQATFSALATSCANAALLFNKQVGFGGLLAGSSKATVIAAAEAINHNRFVLVAPGVIDLNGNLLSGSMAAAIAASEVSKNSDISDDLNLDVLVNLSGIELNSFGEPLFLQRVVSGVVVNDFEDVLQAGGSPLMTDRTGLGVRITHLRMTWTGVTPESDYTYDALMTRLIDDQVFLDVRDYCYDNNFLRKGNTPTVRNALQAGIEALLTARAAWISPVTQSDGTLGYNVSIIPSPDQRQVTIHYEGIIVRGIATIAVDAELSIPV